MLILKFIAQSYVLSIAIKSLMYKFVSKFQYFHHPSHDTQDFRTLEEIYYRHGLCPQDGIDPRYFCDVIHIL